MIAQMRLDGEPAPVEQSTGNARIDKLLRQLDDAWQEFHASYAGLTDEQLLIPGVCGQW